MESPESVEPTQWRALLTPRYTQGSVTIDQLKVEVEVGSFLELRRGFGVGVNTKLCRLIGWELDPLTKKVVLFVNLYDVRRPDDQNTLNDLCRHMPVARQKGDVEIIEVRDVVDISYVFHHSTLVSHQYSAQGRTDSYVAFEREVDAGLPFPCLHPLFNRQNSYARQMWDELQGVKRLIVTTVSSQRYDQSASSRRSESTFMTSDGFDYMSRQVKHLDGVTYLRRKPRQKVRSDYESLPGGDSMTKRRKFDCSQLVVNLDGLLFLFGQSSVFGVRKAKPRVDDGVRPLAFNDRFSIPTQATFTHHDNKVHVVVEYVLYVYSVRRDGSVVNPCPEQFLAFLNREPPIMPNMFPPRDRVPFYEGRPDSLMGWNLDEDELLAVGKVYCVNQERNEIVGVRDGGRTVELAAVCDGEFSFIEREEMLRQIREL